MVLDGTFHGLQRQTSPLVLLTYCSKIGDVNRLSARVRVRSGKFSLRVTLVLGGVALRDTSLDAIASDGSRIVSFL